MKRGEARNEGPEELLSGKFRVPENSLVWLEFRCKMKRAEDESKRVGRLYVTLNFVPIKII